MQQYMYSITTFIFAVILTMILVNDRLNSDPKNNLGKSFRRLLAWIIFFFAQDFFWGLCNSKIINNSNIFYISSTFFHILTVITTFFWLDYILTYLQKRIHHRKIYITIDIVIILFQTTLVIINFFTPIIFSIKDGKYVIEFLRPLAFFNQYTGYLLTSIIAFICSFKENQITRNKYLSVVFFSFFPVIAGLFQVIDPYSPFHSIGYFLSCFSIHIFIVAKDREDISHNKILTTIANTYYSLHIIDLKKNLSYKILESKILENTFGNVSDPKKMVDLLINKIISEEYIETVREFIDFNTLSERMKDKNYISCDFFGKNYGWTRMNIISMERNEDVLTKVMITTKIINEEKNNQIELKFKSSHDQLTGLYNRMEYEEEIQKLAQNPLDKSLVYISMDVNDLKKTNDTLGHAAGDEIIKGAADCIQKIFGVYGKTFRIGGDEFCALIYISIQELDKLKAEFDEWILKWTGKYSKSMSISSGYVTTIEFNEPNIYEMANLADKKMYQSKHDFYRQKGIDRRGQKDAHLALCAIYSKILKINISNDSYQIIDLQYQDQDEESCQAPSFSLWIKNFSEKFIHPDDVQNFLEKTSSKYINEYFKGNKKNLFITYRKKIKKEYKKVIIDLIPTNEYSNENKSFYLYSKFVD